MKRSFLSLLVVFLFVGSADAGLINIFDDSFAAAPDGPLTDFGSWDSQPNWTISGGKATASGTAFQRARRFGAFRAENGEQIKITLSDLVITGAGSGSNNLFAFGVAKTNEHSGATTPQLRSELQFNGTSLSIGGATDTGYTSGDSIDLMLTYTRSGSSWSVETMITNNTDTTSFTGAVASPTNLAGTVSTETVAQWMDASAGNNLLFGMRELGNNGNVLSLGGVRLDINAVPEPTSCVLFLAATSCVALVRRRR